MNALSETNWQIIQKMYLFDHHNQVRQCLLDECGVNLPFLQENKLELERVRTAVLKLSQGDLDKLLMIIIGAQTDWRDTLVAAGFDYDAEKHISWADEYLSESMNG